MEYNQLIKNFIFPHITNKKQKKEMPFINCYNIRLLSEEYVSNKEEYKNYFEVSITLIKLTI